MNVVQAKKKASHNVIKGQIHCENFFGVIPNKISFTSNSHCQIFPEDYESFVASLLFIWQYKRNTKRVIACADVCESVVSSMLHDMIMNFGLSNKTSHEHGIQRRENCTILVQCHSHKFSGVETSQKFCNSLVVSWSLVQKKNWLISYFTVC